MTTESEHYSEYRRQHNAQPAKEGYEAAVARYRKACASASEYVRRIDEHGVEDDDTDSFVTIINEIQSELQDASHDVWEAGPWLDEFDDLWQAYRDVHDAHLRYLYRRFRWQEQQAINELSMDAEVARNRWTQHYRSPS